MVRYVVLGMSMLLCWHIGLAQSGLNTGNPGQPTTLQNAPQRDTNANKSNTTKWKNHEAKISFKKLNSERVYTPDTALHTFHRRPFSQPWYQDLGNLGSPTQSLLFVPDDRLGPTLGYHINDVYRFDLDSLNYYNTTRPYAAFTFNLGSKLEQMAALSYTQNIDARWNFSFDYRKINSPGFYKIQRNNHDNVNFNTSFKSRDQHYELFGALVYNKEQHDENGGIVATSQLGDPNYNDRKTLDVAYENDAYSVTRSPVSNLQRDFGLLLQQSYTWGHGDTLYNSDSTSYTYKLTPRFRITHKLELSTEKHEYKDLIPDSLRYSELFAHSFSNNGIYVPGQTDTVIAGQKWFWIDNRVLLNTLLGKVGRQLIINAGIGNRIDNFTSYYGTGSNSNTIVSNYLIGEASKEALAPGEWFYKADAKFFLTGADAGDFLLHGTVGRDVKAGSIAAGFQQQLNNAPYSYTNYENQYYKLSTSFDKESITQVFASLHSSFFALTLGARLYLIDNYIYINENQLPAQYSIPFNITQLWLRKTIRFGHFLLDNELAYQQKTGNAPVNIPAILGRHQFSYERSLFHSALKIATGIEVRYTTAYNPSGYDPLLNRFYYQTAYFITNTPEASAFFNFRIKRFRAFIMGDQLQQTFLQNKMPYAGYPLQDVMVRFGFSWVLID